MTSTAAQTPPDVLTPDELADELRVNPATIRRMCDRGDFPDAMKVGKQWRIPRSALNALKKTAA